MVIPYMYKYDSRNFMEETLLGFAVLKLTVCWPRAWRTVSFW